MPQYPEVLDRVKHGQSFLDLGCGMGQDLRLLVSAILLGNFATLRVFQPSCIAALGLDSIFLNTMPGC